MIRREFGLGGWRPGPDALAALTVVALLAPESVAYAQIARIPPQYGLVAAPLTLLAYALIGHSKVLAVGATAATAVLSAATVAQEAQDPAQRLELTAASALLAGAFLVLTGLARCGFIVRFLTPEALTGFLAGLALVVIVRQVGVIVHVPAGPGDAFMKSWHVLRRPDHWRVLPIVVGLSTLGALLILERRLPKLPGTLTVLVLAWIVSVAAGLKSCGVAVVGPIPSITPAFKVPQLSTREWSHLAGGALGLALVVFVMSYSVTTRTAAEDESPPDANREMLALGFANVLAGLVGGLASGGSPSASAAAHLAGARTKLTAIFAAGLMLLIAALCTPVCTSLPEPALAAVVIAAVRGFLAVPTFRRYLRLDRSSLLIALTALLGVLTLDLLPGLLLAVGVSLILFIARASRLRVSELGRIDGTSTYLATERYPGAIRTPGLLILRPDGELFFANVSRLTSSAEAAAGEAGVKVLLLDMTATFDLKLVELDALQLLRLRLSRHKIELWFVHLYLAASDAVKRSELADVVTFTDTQAAVHFFEKGEYLPLLSYVTEAKTAHRP